MATIERALAGEVSEPLAPDVVIPPAATPALPPEPPAVLAEPIAAAPPEAAAPPIGSSQDPIHRRHFTCVEDGAKKFWEISVVGRRLTVRFGRIGTGGQTQHKDFGTPEAAAREQDKLVRSKLAKGYLESQAAQ